MWNTLFDKIILINSPADTHRLAESSHELMRYAIPFEVVATETAETPARSRYLTMKGIFLNAVENGVDRLLVFNDTFRFAEDPNYYMPWIMDQLEENPYWQALYLGPIVQKPLHRVSPNILQANACRGLLSVAYSKNGIEAMISRLKFFSVCPAQLMEQQIQAEGQCFATFPLMVTGRPVATTAKDYPDQLTNRYNHFTQHLTP